MFVCDLLRFVGGTVADSDNSHFRDPRPSLVMETAEIAGSYTHAFQFLTHGLVCESHLTKQYHFLHSQERQRKASQERACSHPAPTQECPARSAL